MRALKRDSWIDELVEAFRSGGHVAAITAAGAFGGMLAASGIGDYVATTLADLGTPLLVAGRVIAATVRVSQGSATVAVLATAGIVAPSVPDLAVHPVYLAPIVGAGGNIFSWFDDSGFWIVTEIGGLARTETLQMWTVPTTVISVTGFVIVMVTSTILPLARPVRRRRCGGKSTHAVRSDARPGRALYPPSRSVVPPAAVATTRRVETTRSDEGANY